MFFHLCAGAELNHDASLALTARHANNENAVTIVSPNGQSGADTTTHNDSGNSGNSDGLAELEKASLLRFTEDDRMHEVSIFRIIILLQALMNLWFL